jgi:hypothetical protein
MLKSFPYESKYYWYKMRDMHDPLPVFKSKGEHYVIREVRIELHPSSMVIDTKEPYWSYLNRHACKVNFMKIDTTLEKGK